MNKYKYRKVLIKKDKTTPTLGCYVFQFSAIFLKHKTQNYFFRTDNLLLSGLRVSNSLFSPTHNFLFCTRPQCKVLETVYYKLEIVVESRKKSYSVS